MFSLLMQCPVIELRNHLCKHPDTDFMNSLCSTILNCFCYTIFQEEIRTSTTKALIMNLIKSVKSERTIENPHTLPWPRLVPLAVVSVEHMLVPVIDVASKMRKRHL